MCPTQNTQAFETYESEVRSYCRNFPAVFTTAQGPFLYDEGGKAYIDFFCGAGALNYGHNPPFIRDRLVEYLQSNGVMHALDMYTQPKRDFIQFYEENVLKPRGLDYKLQFPGPTGTNAVEAALKLARKVKKRPGIFALMGAFHGMTLGSIALTTDAASRAGAGVPLGHVTHIPAPYMFPELDTIRYMETLLTDDHSGVEKPAAIILETTQADGGIYPLPVPYLQDLRALCDRHDILLIVDDVQVGCARTGWFFSFQRAGIVPDIVTQSKSIGGYGMPFALVLIKPALDVWEPGEHNGTFRGYQLSMVAAKAGLELMLNEKVADHRPGTGEDHHPGRGLCVGHRPGRLRRRPGPRHSQQAGPGCRLPAGAHCRAGRPGQHRGQGHAPPDHRGRNPAPGAGDSGKRGQRNGIGVITGPCGPANPRQQ